MKPIVYSPSFHMSLVGIIILAASVISLPASAKRPIDNEGSISSGPFHLNYQIEGEGRPALVIGLPLYSARTFSENLRSHLKLVFVDHRGSAASPGLVPLSEFSLQRLVDDVELVRRTLRLGRIAVIGHSGQAYFALEYAKKYPENVSHVIMISIAPKLSAETYQAAAIKWEMTASPERKMAYEELQNSITAEQLAQLPLSETFVLQYIMNGPRAWYDPYFDATPLWEGVDFNMQMFNYVWGELFRDLDITVGLQELDRPVFLALGRYDFNLPPTSSWNIFMQYFNDMTVRIFEQSGHTPQYEQQALFDQELLSWMEQYDD